MLAYRKERRRSSLLAAPADVSAQHLRGAGNVTRAQTALAAAFEAATGDVSLGAHMLITSVVDSVVEPASPASSDAPENLSSRYDRLPTLEARYAKVCWAAVLILFRSD